MKTAIAIIMIVIFAPVTIYRSYRVTLQPSDPNPSEMRALAWAVHFGKFPRKFFLKILN